METGNLQSLIILPDSTAPSFCYYDSSNAQHEIMSVGSLQKAVDFCEENDLSATVVYGDKLTDEHYRILNGFPHVRIISASKIHTFPFLETDVAVMEYGVDSFENFDEKRKYHVVLRMNLNEVRSLPMLVFQHHTLFSRLNVVVKDIAGANEETLNRFRLDLQPMKEVMFRLFRENRFFELNIVTDRLVLDAVKSCDAGIKHLTLAPDGRFYLCPAFYYDTKKYAVGSLGEVINIPNRHLLQIEYATLCRLCDCYHCRRCAYLNKKLTGEFNTPSRQQCVLSHHERNLSGMLLQKLQSKGILANAKTIPPLYYLDPLEYYKDIVK